MTVFNGGYDYNMSSGLMNLHCIKQLLFCIAQEESASQELDTYSMLGISKLLDEAGYEIEQSHDKIQNKLEAAIERHNKLRAALAGYKETDRMVNKSVIDRILADDEKENHGVN